MEFSGNHQALADNAKLIRKPAPCAL